MANLKELLHSLKRSVYFKRSVILVSGTAISQVLAVLFQLVLRRLFDPEVFGAYAVYLSTFSILAVLTSFKYEMAIVIPRRDKHAVALFYLSVLINVIFALLLFLVFLVFKTQLAGIISLNPSYSDWLLLMPLGLIFFGLQKSINFWLIRKKRFRYSSYNKVVRRAAEGLAQSLFGVVKMPVGLVWGQIFGNVGFNLMGVRQLKKTGFFSIPVGRPVLRYVRKRYMNFPTYQALPHLLNTVSLMIPVIIVNVLYQESVTGYFDLTRQVLALPLALVSTSLSQIILQDISERRNNRQKITKRIMNTFWMLSLISLPGILILLLWAKPLFGFIFGNEWQLSGKIAQILVFSYAIKFIISPLSSVLTALENLKVLAVWRIFYFIAIVALFFLNDVEAFRFFQIYMFIEVGFYIIYFFIIWLSCAKYDQNLTVA